MNAETQAANHAMHDQLSSHRGVEHDEGVRIMEDFLRTKCREQKVAVPIAAVSLAELMVEEPSGVLLALVYGVPIFTGDFSDQWDIRQVLWERFVHLRLRHAERLISLVMSYSERTR